MNCPSCGAANHPDFAFCLQCGHALGSTAPTADLMAETRADMLPLDAAPASSDPLGSSRGGAGVVARLRVEQGSVDEQEIVLDRPELVIGRRQDSDIIIHDTNVSRHHARIMRDGARVLIEDTNSSNGTLVNDQRIEGVRELRPGDVVRIGDAVFVFEVEEAGAGAPEGSTMAIDLDSPMTSLGSAPELLPPSLVAPEPRQGPLTPPPSIMEGRQTAIADSLSFEEPEPPSPPPPSQAPSESNISQRSPGHVVPAGGGLLPVGSSAGSGGAGPSGESGPGGPGAASGGGSTSAQLDALRRELTEVGRELLTFSGTLNGLADRVERLERALDAATGDLASVADVVRGPDASALRELQGIVGEIERSEDGPRLEEATRVLEQLAAQPRDIELLLKLSQQASALESALRLHARLVAVAPRLGASLGRLVG